MEYIALFTNKGTGKRVRLKDLERTTRARKGVLIIREVKTNPHKVLNAFVTDSKGLFGVKTTKDIITIKASELTIMDRYSTGTSIYKGTLIDAFEVCTLKDASYEVEEEIVVEEDNTEETEYKQLSLLDIDDNLNKVDDILNMTKKDL